MRCGYMSDGIHKAFVIALRKSEPWFGTVGLENLQFVLESLGKANAFILHRFLLANVPFRIVLTVETDHRLDVRKLGNVVGQVST